jgi:hypothetical protein
MEAETDQAQRHHSSQQPDGSAPVLAGSSMPFTHIRPADQQLQVG